ncbi:MAG: hypothetical protein JKY50_07320 [Oleispira sp.]|nr:hypothetical protein [Oleispira sp.]MBL4881189.1 hypothetical protein [Oleispira sp.]
MINYQQLKQTQHNGALLSNAVIFALSCQIRLEEGEPEVKAGLEFDKSEYSYEQENGRHHLAKNTYRLADGEICTSREAATQLGLSEARTIDLFTRYCNRWSIVHKNHGINAQGNKYKTADGASSTIKDLSKLYGYSQASISRYFSAADGDYIAANKNLKEMADKRAAADKRAPEKMKEWK